MNKASCLIPRFQFKTERGCAFKVEAPRVGNSRPLDPLCEDFVNDFKL